MPVHLKCLGLVLRQLCLDPPRTFDSVLTRLVGPWLFPSPCASPLPPYLPWSAPWLPSHPLGAFVWPQLLRYLVALLSWHGFCHAKLASPLISSVHIDAERQISSSGEGGGAAVVVVVGVEALVRVAVGLARVGLVVLDRQRLCRPVLPAGPP